MPDLVFFNSLTTEVAAGTHAAALNTSTDTLEIYLTNTTPSVGTHTIKSELAEIATGNGYTGPVDTVNTVSLTGGLISVIGTGPTFTAAGGAIATFRYAVLNNLTANKLIGYWDSGTAQNLADTQSFTVNTGAEMFKVGA